MAGAERAAGDGVAERGAHPSRPKRVTPALRGVHRGALNAGEVSTSFPPSRGRRGSRRPSIRPPPVLEDVMVSGRDLKGLYHIVRDHGSIVSTTLCGRMVYSDTETADSVPLHDTCFECADILHRIELPAAERVPLMRHLARHRLGAYVGGSW